MQHQPNTGNGGRPWNRGDGPFVFSFGPGRLALAEVWNHSIRVRRTAKVYGGAACLFIMLLTVLFTMRSQATPIPPRLVVGVVSFLACGGLACSFACIVYRRRAGDLDKKRREDSTSRLSEFQTLHHHDEARMWLLERQRVDRQRAAAVAEGFRRGTVKTLIETVLPLEPKEVSFHRAPAVLRVTDDEGQTVSEDNGTLTLTNRRIVFSCKGQLGEAPLDRLEAVQWIEDRGILIRTKASALSFLFRLDFPSEFMAYVLGVLNKEGLPLDVRAEPSAAN